jgi:histidyl-tRNA synthetase
VARAYVEHNLHVGPRPTKVFYIGPMFRYERPQAGRYRQHQQIGAELIGSASPAADFEMISLLVDLLGSVGLADLRVLLNSVGDANCRPGFTDALREYLGNHGDALCPDCVRRVEMNPLRVLDCKVPGCREVAKGMPGIQEYLCEDCRAHQDRLLTSLRRAEVEVELDDRLVRGLDYYTRTVFEIQHGGLGAQSAVGGGGRYDNLVKEVGGPQIPAVGFSTGVERILLALEADGVALPGIPAPEVAIVVVGGDAEREAALVLARRLRRRFAVDVDLLERGVGGQMKAANRLGARVTVVVGEGELSRGDWTVKNMESGEQAPVADDALETHLETLFARA